MRLRLSSRPRNESHRCGILVLITFCEQLRVAQRKRGCCKSGRIRANTGDQFFCYGRNFDMMYDTHKVKIGVFLLPKRYLLIRYRNQVDLFLNQNKMKYGSIRFRFTFTFLGRCISRVESITLRSDFCKKVY